jgi:nitrate reductase alpha subunit
MIIVNEWFWTATCEYADIVFAVDSWPERKIPEVYGSCTNPFLQAAPRTPLPRIFDTKDDIECYAGVSAKLADLTGVDGFREYWKFVYEGDIEYYIDRVFKPGNATKGYSFKELEESCRNGVPFFFATRTTPRVVGWEQVNESKPWYTKTGRLEFYRDEDEFIEYGENLPVWREQVDSTFYEPNVIVSKPISFLKPKQPQEYGLELNELSPEVRQLRNVIKPWVNVKSTRHPLVNLGYTHILYTPKYRHACHTMGASTDIEVVFFGPFGDFHRRDKRKPWVGEGYVDINPLDAKELGIEDGDYIWVDADPSDRPFRQWGKRLEDYKVARWLVRARYYPNMPRRTARAWFHFYMATHGSVEGHETRPDGLAKNPRTNYQAGYRYGSHQSITRAWLKPTLMTDSLVRKDPYGQSIGKGYAVDIHTVVGAPKESFVKISKAEDGGLNGKGLWYPALLGFRPTYENEAVKRYLDGGYVEVK